MDDTILIGLTNKKAIERLRELEASHLIKVLNKKMDTASPNYLKSIKASLAKRKAKN